MSCCPLAICHSTPAGIAQNEPAASEPADDLSEEETTTEGLATPHPCTEPAAAAAQPSLPEAAPGSIDAPAGPAPAAEDDLTNGGPNFECSLGGLSYEVLKSNLQDPAGGWVG
jgi:hypothetical protein